MHKKISSLIRIGFKDALAYRFHFYVTMITSPLQLLIYYFLWNAIFTYSRMETINGFTLDTLISYYALNMIIGFFTWTNVDEWIERDVRSGELIGSLLKPFKLIYINFFNILGISSLAILIEIIPLFLIAVFFFELKIAPLFYFTAFLISIAFALVISFFISSIVGMTAFWLNNISGIRRVKRVLIVFLSGGMIPLTFFPEAFQEIFFYLPFQYLRFIPISIYLQKYDYLKIIALIGIQIIWILSLYFISEFIWKKAFRKFAGAGS